jgi:hypothetical protein
MDAGSFPDIYQEYLDLFTFIDVLKSTKKRTIKKNVGYVMPNRQGSVCPRPRGDTTGRTRAAAAKF